MATARAFAAPEWPRLDLAKHNVTSLVLRWSVPWTSDVEATLGGLLDEDGDFIRLRSYSKNKVRHYRSEMAFRFPEDNNLVVVLRYGSDRDRPPETMFKTFGRRGSILERLMTTRPDEEIQCSADLEYPRNADYFTAFPLPFVMSPTEGFNLPYDEIRGIRGVKFDESDNDDSGYNFILDRHRKEDIDLALIFSLANCPADAAPDQALARSVAISEKLVMRLED